MARARATSVFFLAAALCLAVLARPAAAITCPLAAEGSLCGAGSSCIALDLTIAGGFNVKTNLAQCAPLNCGNATTAAGADLVNAFINAVSPGSAATVSTCRDGAAGGRCDIPLVDCSRLTLQAATSLGPSAASVAGLPTNNSAVGVYDSAAGRVIPTCIAVPAANGSNGQYLCVADDAAKSTCAHFKAINPSTVCTTSGAGRLAASAVAVLFAVALSLVL